MTGFEYKLYPVGPEVMAGAIAWRAESAGEVLEMSAPSWNKPLRSSFA